MSLKGHRKLPDFIRDAPQLFPWLVPYYNAFEELSTDRPMGGFGDVGFIPWSSIDRYCRRHAWLDFATALRYVRVLDFKFRKLVAENKPKDQDRGKSGKPASRPPAVPPRRRGKTW